MKDVVQIGGTCASCIFSTPAIVDGDFPVVMCRRNPPQLVMWEDVVSQAWPQMRENDWCGEYFEVIKITEVNDAELSGDPDAG